MKVQTLVRIGTLALALGSFLVTNTARSDEYEFPEYEQKKTTKKKASGGKKKGKTPPKEKGPDFFFPKIGLEKLNQCDFNINSHVKVFGPASPNDAYSVDLADLSANVGTVRRLECWVDKNDLTSITHFVEFEMREDKDGAKSWQPLMICGSIAKKAPVKAIFDKFVKATWQPEHKKVLAKLAKDSTARVCANDFKDGSHSVEVTWTKIASKKGEKLAVEDHVMYVGYSSEGYEHSRRYEVKTVRGDSDDNRDEFLSRQLIFNKDLVVGLETKDFTKDNPLADERTTRTVYISGKGLTLGYSSAAIDGNKQDRTLTVYKTSLQSGELEPALLPRNISVDKGFNNVFGWLKEIELEVTQGESQVARINLAADKLGKFLIETDYVAAFPVTFMTKETSDQYIRKIYSHFGQ